MHRNGRNHQQIQRSQYLVDHDRTRQSVDRTNARVHPRLPKWRYCSLAVERTNNWSATIRERHRLIHRIDSHAILLYQWNTQGHTFDRHVSLNGEPTDAASRYHGLEFVHHFLLTKKKDLDRIACLAIYLPYGFVSYLPRWYVDCHYRI